MADTPIHQVAAGEVIEFNSAKGAVKIEVLWPAKAQSTFEALPGDGSAINNSSIALLVTVGKIRIFSAGDLEPQAQQAMLAIAKIDPIDIYKVSHHGSTYQYLPLMTELSPKVALISVGAGNSYGHPAANTVSALKTLGAKVLRTDLDGAIAIDASQMTLKIRTKRNDWWNISWG